jgi:hypothetical protein
MPRNLRCVVCNAQIDVPAGGFGFFLSLPAGNPRRPPGYLMHNDCAHRIAHPDFDFTVDLTGRDVASSDE